MIRYYADTSIAFVVDEELEKHFKKLNAKIKDMDDFLYERGFETIYNVCGGIIAPVLEDKVDTKNLRYINEDRIILTEVTHLYPYKCEYTSKEDMVKYIKDKFGYMLPDDYDIASHIYYVELVMQEG